MLDMQIHVSPQVWKVFSQNFFKYCFCSFHYLLILHTLSEYAGSEPEFP